MDPESFTQKAKTLADSAQDLAAQATSLAGDAGQLAVQSGGQVGLSPLMIGLTVFVLAVFVGYHVVWRVTPALHSPLMSVTNAISSVIVVGALVAAGADLDAGATWLTRVFGFLGVILASVNIFGGFLVTERMLAMYKKKT